MVLNAAEFAPIPAAELRKLVNDSQFTQAQLAERLGVSQRTMRSYLSEETYKHKPPPYLVGYAVQVICTEKEWIPLKTEDLVARFEELSACGQFAFKLR